MIHILALLAATTLPSTPPEVSAQVRVRGEKSMSGPIGLAPANPNYRTTQRTRVGIASKGSVSWSIAIQDVRTWGSESSTLDNTGGSVDFNEGWVEFGQDYKLRVGRQSIAYDGQRLIGSVDWTQQGRFFDAVTLSLESIQTSLSVSRVRDGGLHDVAMGHFSHNFDDLTLSIPLIVQTNRFVAPESRDDGPWSRITAGAYLEGGDTLTWRAEGYGQKKGDSMAYLAGLRAGYNINSWISPTIWADIVSGEDGNNEPFDTLFGTNHKFYGHADRFLNLPRDTQGRGLIDIALKNQGQVGPGTLKIAFHHFAVATDDSVEGSTALGQEIDIVYEVTLFEGCYLVAGASLFIPSKPSGSAESALQDWSFVQLDIRG